jgi:hypothetical protein
MVYYVGVAGFNGGSLLDDVTVSTMYEVTIPKTTAVCNAYLRTIGFRSCSHLRNCYTSIVEQESSLSFTVVCSVFGFYSCSYITDCISNIIVAYVYYTEEAKNEVYGFFDSTVLHNNRSTVIIRHVSGVNGGTTGFDAIGLYSCRQISNNYIQVSIEDWSGYMNDRVIATGIYNGTSPSAGYVTNNNVYLGIKPTNPQYLRNIGISGGINCLGNHVIYADTGKSYVSSAWGNSTSTNLIPVNGDTTGAYGYNTAFGQQ